MTEAAPLSAQEALRLFEPIARMVEAVLPLRPVLQAVVDAEASLQQLRADQEQLRGSVASLHRDLEHETAAATERRQAARVAVRDAEAMATEALEAARQRVRDQTEAVQGELVVARADADAALARLAEGVRVAQAEADEARRRIAEDLDTRRAELAGVEAQLADARAALAAHVDGVTAHLEAVKGLASGPRPPEEGR